MSSRHHSASDPKTVSSKVKRYVFRFFYAFLHKVQLLIKNSIIESNGLPYAVGFGEKNLCLLLHSKFIPVQEMEDNENRKMLMHIIRLILLNNIFIRTG